MPLATNWSNSDTMRAWVNSLPHISQWMAPYSRGGVRKLPSPNPRHHWNVEHVPGDATAAVAVSGGCKFAPRCPRVMPKCRDNFPALYRTDDHRVAACFLHETAKPIEAGAIDEVFV